MYCKALCKALYVITKEKGQIPFPRDRAIYDDDKVKTGLYRDKKILMYKEKDKKDALLLPPPTHTTHTATVPI